MARHAPLCSPVVHTPIHDDGDGSTHVTIHTPNNGNLKDPPQETTRRSSTHGQQRPMYSLQVDPLQGDRATEIKLLSIARPHMRAFHYSWVSFFVAFFGWFSIPPLMPTIKKQLQLNADQVANSNIASVASTIAGRVIVGPLCDRYGPRVVQAALLIVGAIPVACASLVTSYTGLMVVRFFIGLVGCAFVATTCWTSLMFSNQVIGSANALAAGWGNLGAGVAYLVTPFIFDLLTWDGIGVSDHLGWRLTLVVPAVVMVVVGVLLYLFSDDCPHGNFADFHKSKPVHQAAIGGDDMAALKPASVDMATSLRLVCKRPATWILAFQYACSFGVELQVHNVLSLYYYEDFTSSDCVEEVSSCRRLSQTTAALVSSLFGLMCIFARALGGIASDYANRKYAMPGRILMQFLAFTGQALTLFAYSQSRSVSTSIPWLICFGIFVQACTGTTFAIVPYVAPRSTGATSGIVGAGGNVGALCWAFLFKGVGDRAKSFEYLSFVVVCAAILCGFTTVEGDNGSAWRCLMNRRRRRADHDTRRTLSTHSVMMAQRLVLNSDPSHEVNDPNMEGVSCQSRHRPTPLDA